MRPVRAQGTGTSRPGKDADVAGSVALGDPDGVARGSAPGGLRDMRSANDAGSMGTNRLAIHETFRGRGSVVSAARGSDGYIAVLRDRLGERRKNRPTGGRREAGWTWSRGRVPRRGRDQLREAAEVSDGHRGSRDRPSGVGSGREERRDSPRVRQPADGGRPHGGRPCATPPGPAAARFRARRARRPHPATAGANATQARAAPRAGRA